MMSGRGQTKISMSILHDSIYALFQKMQTNLWWKKAEQWYLRDRARHGQGQEEAITKGYKETFGGNGCYFECGD